ncbi:sugar lactone lactonase YvrE [Tamaricihabitans halophyticus]|uniref:Sugar lactone lactonase YvrE n=1 Tax=Tamaricihabitans halophyticus TaxID=1262583 RepID=A0A4V2SV00_9PSEU|nr:SMP-30/gluconolactonase/LRE family protein [Tamaricihabitans halophyticus]TCP56576.1 sugar lactone lactonase YvrE [Tamaricihabitans halophyticus]
MVEALAETTASLGEGPHWDAATGTLLWVDISAGEVHRSDPDSGRTKTLRLGGPVSMVVPSEHGRLLVARQHKLSLVDGSGVEEVVAAIPADPLIRFNDGKCDPRGRLFVGTMHTERAPGTAALYRLDGTELTPVLTGLTVSNGLGWSPDGGTMYHADTPSGCVRAYDYELETGHLRTPGRVFVDLTKQVGRPDGLTVDADGYVWVVLVRAGAVHRYAPDGTLDAVHAVPVSAPTSCAFGGPGLTDLFVTTSLELVPEDQRGQQPLAGRVLRLHPGVPGRPAPNWSPQDA